MPGVDGYEGIEMKRSLNKESILLSSEAKWVRFSSGPNHTIIYRYNGSQTNVLPTNNK